MKMGEPEIHISVKAFCPELTLPCSKGTAYPDRYSCQHFYFCDERGEIRRFTCGTGATNNMVRLNKGAAICVNQRRSTCNKLLPSRQCDSIQGYLPNEYCEVEVPPASIWTYPDPEDCKGFYKYTPPDYNLSDRHELVVQRRMCPNGAYYSPMERDCVPLNGNGSSLCGGRWIRENQECRLVKRGFVSVARHDNTAITAQYPTLNVNQTTALAASDSTPQPPAIVPFNAVSILALVVGLAAALVLLIVIATLSIVVFRKLRRKRRLLNRSYSAHDTPEVTGMEISRPLSFAEFNEYAAIDDVFGNTLERSRLMENGGNSPRPSNRPDRNAATGGRTVPDGYGSSEAPTLPPRPKSTASYSASERPDLKTHKSVGCCATDSQRSQSTGFSKSQAENENPKVLQNVNWQTALNSSMPDDSYSSDEYEAINFTPINSTHQRESSIGESKPPVDNLKQLTECQDLDNQEYMIPVVARADQDIPDSAPLVIPLRVGRRTHSLPHRRAQRAQSLKGFLPYDTTRIKDDLIGVQNGKYNNVHTGKSSKCDLGHTDSLDKYPVKQAQTENYPDVRFSRVSDDDYDWDISDSWIRTGKANASNASGKSAANTEQPRTAEILMDKSLENVEKDNSDCTMADVCLDSDRQVSCSDLTTTHVGLDASLETVISKDGKTGTNVYSVQEDIVRSDEENIPGDKGQVINHPKKDISLGEGEDVKDIKNETPPLGGQVINLPTEITQEVNGEQKIDSVKDVLPLADHQELNPVKDALSLGHQQEMNSIKKVLSVGDEQETNPTEGALPVVEELENFVKEDLPIGNKEEINFTKEALPIGNDGGTNNGDGDIQTTSDFQGTMPTESVENMDCNDGEVTSTSQPHHIGYEILVTASSPTDFRVYQYISADSASSSSSQDDLQSIPDIQLSVVAQTNSTTNHDYFVLDTHQESENLADLANDRNPRTLAVFEPQQRQSCNF